MGRRQAYATMVFVAALFCAPLSSIAATRDGNWWNAQSRAFQTAWVVGFLHGVVSADGQMKSILGFALLNSAYVCQGDDQACPININEYAHYLEKEIDKDEHAYVAVTVGQIVDGISNTYSDYRNRSIGIIDAEQLVIDSIRGLTDEQIQQRLSHLRELYSK